jgi:hypothetical protein
MWPVSCAKPVIPNRWSRIPPWRNWAVTDFPHEVGVFLGYPLKDVAGFMGWVDLPVTCQGPWKIYGNPDRSLALADGFRACRLRMDQRLRCCANASDCLRTNMMTCTNRNDVQTVPMRAQRHG